MNIVYALKVRSINLKLYVKWLIILGWTSVPLPILFITFIDVDIQLGHAFCIPFAFAKSLSQTFMGISIYFIIFSSGFLVTVLTLYVIIIKHTTESRNKLAGSKTKNNKSDYLIMILKIIGILVSHLVTVIVTVIVAMLNLLNVDIEPVVASVIVIFILPLNTISDPVMLTLISVRQLW